MEIRVRRLTNRTWPLESIYDSIYGAYVNIGDSICGAYVNIRDSIRGAYVLVSSDLNTLFLGYFEGN